VRERERERAEREEQVRVDVALSLCLFLCQAVMETSWWVFAARPACREVVSASKSGSLRHARISVDSEVYLAGCRSAVAAPSLPFNCAVEVEAVIEIGPSALGPPSAL